MRLANSILMMPALGTGAIILVCVALSSWRLVTSNLTFLQSVAHRIAAKYDSALPEITVRNGRLSIRENVPSVWYPLKGKDLPLVIDTRDVKLHLLLDSLKDFNQGIVLGADRIALKYRVRTCIVPLRDVPDMVLNSRNIDEFISLYLSESKSRLTVYLILYVLLAKLLQAACLGSVTYLLSRWLFSEPMTYTESIKIACFAMIPPVLLDFRPGITGAGVAGTLVGYFGVYVILIGLCVTAVYGARRNRRMESRPVGADRTSL
jgi:hypothetical protein